MKKRAKIKKSTKRRETAERQVKQDQTRHWNRACSGSFTVEASLLMPLLLLVVIAVIYLGFYLHDKCVGRAEIQRALVQLTTLSDPETITGNQLTVKEENQVLERLNQSVKGRMFLAKEVHSELLGTGSEVKIQLECKLQIPFFFVRRMLGSKTLEFNETRKVHDPMSSARVGKMLYGEISRMSTYETVRQSIEKVRSLFE